MELLPILCEDGAHLPNRRRVNFVTSAEMSGPIAVNDRQ